MQLGVGFTPNYFLVLSKTLNYWQIQYQKFRAHHRNIKRAASGCVRASFARATPSGNAGHLRRK